jgi:hypothetical protein
MDHHDLNPRGRFPAVVWLGRTGHRALTVLWDGLVALGTYSFCPSVLPPGLAAAAGQSSECRADAARAALDVPPGRHPERLVPYESLTAEERRIWMELDARVG